MKWMVAYNISDYFPENIGLLLGIISKIPTITNEKFPVIARSSPGEIRSVSKLKTLPEEKISDTIKRIQVSNPS